MRRTLTALTTAIVTAGLVTFVPPANGDPAPAAPIAAAAARVLTLPTGQRVLFRHTADGQPVVGPVPGSPWPADDPVLPATMGGHVYAIPRSAVPELGQQLDVSMFDLTRLADVEQADGSGQIPVSVNAPVPGVTPTGPGAGLLTPGQFGTALPAGARLSLAGATPRAASSGGVNLSTLTIDTVDQNGAPAFGVLIQLMNVDDASLFFLTTGIGVSPAKYSVPDGHYSLTAIFTSVENGRLVYRTDVQPQVTVRGPTTITADARRATTEPTVTLPRSADLKVQLMAVTRLAKRNGGMGIFSADEPQPGAVPARLLVSPTAPVTIGQLRYDIAQHYDSPDAGASYTYDLDFPAMGAIPARQVHPVQDRRLATIQARYDSETPGQVAAVGRGALMGGDFTFLGVTDLLPLTVPATRTEYVTADPDAHWDAEMLRSQTGSFTDWFEDAVRTYRPGSTVPSEWLRQPIHPGVHRLGDTPFLPLVCPACRQQDHFNLIIEPFADNVPGHVARQPTLSPGPGETATGSYRLDQDGRTIATGGYLDGVQVPVGADPATYQLTYDVERTAPWWTLSTSTHTVWTFRSSRSHTSLPDDHTWYCDLSAATNCQFLPMIFADYDLPADRTGHEPAGLTSATVHAYYLRPKGMPSIQRVRVEVSFDDGATWRAAPVRAIGGDTYRVSYRNPASAGFATLRLTVTDSAGGRLSQTIQRAYALTP